VSYLQESLALSSKESISVEALEFSYLRNSKPLLKIPDLKIFNGDKVFLFGPSGSGKSTLLSLLTGVLKPQKGQIRLLNNFEISQAPSMAADIFRGAHMGYIFQQFNLLPHLSVRENISLVLDLNPLRLNKVLKSSTVELEIKRLAQHLDIENILDRSAMAISVGQQQRVAAARALIGAPEIIIADEPTSSLDTDRRDLFMKMILREVELSQSTLIFVSHDKSLMKHFNKHFSILDWSAEGVAQ
jgi:putative ABC transport system ATP-binding protein